MTNLEDFLTTYAAKREVHIIDIDALGEDDHAPFIIVRGGGHVLALCPNRNLKGHVNVDAFAFEDNDTEDGEAETVGAFGMSNGFRAKFTETGTTSHGWPSSSMVALIVGEQA